MKSKGIAIIAALIATLVVIPFASADGVIIPGSVKVSKFKKIMKHLGMDLYGGDEADGLVEEGGTQIKVITYRPVTIEQMDWMKEAAQKSLREI